MRRWRGLGLCWLATLVASPVGLLALARRGEAGAPARTTPLAYFYDRRGPEPVAAQFLAQSNEIAVTFLGHGRAGGVILYDRATGAPLRVFAFAPDARRADLAFWR